MRRHTKTRGRGLDSAPSPSNPIVEDLTRLFGRTTSSDGQGWETVRPKGRGEDVSTHLTTVTPTKPGIPTSLTELNFRWFTPALSYPRPRLCPPNNQKRSLTPRTSSLKNKPPLFRFVSGKGKTKSVDGSGVWRPKDKKQSTNYSLPILPNSTN